MIVVIAQSAVRMLVAAMSCCARWRGTVRHQAEARRAATPRATESQAPHIRTDLRHDCSTPHPTARRCLPTELSGVPWRTSPVSARCTWNTTSADAGSWVTRSAPSASSCSTNNSFRSTNRDSHVGCRKRRRQDVSSFRLAAITTWRTEHHRGNFAAAAGNIATANAVPCG